MRGPGIPIKCRHKESEYPSTSRAAQFIKGTSIKGNLRGMADIYLHLQNKSTAASGIRANDKDLASLKT